MTGGGSYKYFETLQVTLQINPQEKLGLKIK